MGSCGDQRSDKRSKKQDEVRAEGHGLPMNIIRAEVGRNILDFQ
jgi:hypothetical protein